MSSLELPDPAIVRFFCIFVCFASASFAGLHKEQPEFRCQTGIFSQRGTTISEPQISISIPLGIVIRRSPGVTRWAKWTWKAIAVLPGAGPADWHQIRCGNGVTDYHAATVELVLYRSDTEAYLTGISTRKPSVYVVMREAVEAGAKQDIEVLLATVSPYDAQDYADSGEEIIELVAMPEGLIDWIKLFIETHHEDEAFIKRRRDKSRVDLVEDGVGDARIAQLTDVYRVPRNAARRARSGTSPGTSQ